MPFNRELNNDIVEHPSTITERINKIIDRRLGRGEWAGNGRLQQIEKAEERLNILRKKIGDLEDLLQQIEHQRQEQRGEYYAMLQKEPQMEEKIGDVKTSNVTKFAALLQEELNLLKKRFSRECVQIAFIGKEGQGKSTFIQAISGLENDVVPAYNGNSCTGAVSVIHNSDRFETRLTFYELSEFLYNVNKKLKKFKSDCSTINTLDELSRIRREEFSEKLNATDAAEFFKFHEHVVEHINDYRDMIGHSPVTLYNPEEVAQYVAQYRFTTERPLGVPEDHLAAVEPKDTEPGGWKELFFKYVAVKSADIYNPFSYTDSGKIVLVDTVGLGPQGEETEKEMYRVLREDCDAAIDLFKPSNDRASFDSEQSNILKNIHDELGNRIPEKWLVYVLNHDRRAGKENQYQIEQVEKTVNALKDNGNLSIAWVKGIDGSNHDEVVDELVIPLLNLIIENLKDIDDNMLETAEKKALTLYNEYVMLCKSVGAVLSSSFKNNQQTMHFFDQLYKQLELSSAMRKLDDSKYEGQNKPCMEIASRLNEITEESIFDALPKMDGIVKAVDAGVKAVPVIFTEEINEFRNRIFDIYESVNVEQLHPLQEYVKMEMIQILFNEGMLGKIPLAGYSVSDGPSPEWLNVLIEETVDKNAYPHVYNALRLILDYQISIEGLIEYNVAKSVHLINPMYPEFFQIPFTPIPTNDVDKQSNHIFQEIFNRITHIQENLRTWIDDFAMIPSHSFYARVHKVREKLFLSVEGNEQLRYYYLDNCGSIWREEIQGIEQVANAFGGWNAMCEDLNSIMDKSFFEI